MRTERSSEAKSKRTRVTVAAPAASITVLLALAAVACLACVACSKSEPVAMFNFDDSGFAPGAFPPALSDMEYHRPAWGTTCLGCHETGKEDAPIVQHTSLPPQAKLVKCRTCHVLVPGSSAK